MGCGELPEAPRLTLRSWALLSAPGWSRPAPRSAAASGWPDRSPRPATAARSSGWRPSRSSRRSSTTWNLPLHALLRRADFHRQVPPAARPAVLAGGVRVSRFRLGVSLPRRERGDAAGRRDPRRNSRCRRRSTTCLAWRSPARSFSAASQYVVFLLALLPLIFGGKVYNSLKAIMSFKIVVVFGFLLVVAALFSTTDTWIEIITGFFKFGSVPVARRRAAAPPQPSTTSFVAWWQGRRCRDRLSA